MFVRACSGCNWLIEMLPAFFAPPAPGAIFGLFFELMFPSSLFAHPPPVTRIVRRWSGSPSLGSYAVNRTELEVRQRPIFSAGFCAMRILRHTTRQPTLPVVLRACKHS